MTTPSSPQSSARLSPRCVTAESLQPAASVSSRCRPSERLELMPPTGEQAASEPQEG